MGDGFIDCHGGCDDGSTCGHSGNDDGFPDGSGNDDDSLADGYGGNVAKNYSNVSPPPLCHQSGGVSM